MDKEKVYAVIDLKSFYAGCECASRGLDPFQTPLVVCDPSRSENTVVMSVTPYLKAKYGVPNVCRMKELPHVENILYATPRMRYYIETSARVVSIFLDFVDEEDLHVYSIDESFLYLTPYLDMYHYSPSELVEQIQKRIEKELHLIATAGMGPNMFLAKTCLDNDGKKKPPYRAYWKQEDVPNTLWKIHPITKIWGISNGISIRLSRLGIRSVEALAKADTRVLVKEFGIIGKQLKNMANGIDESDIREKYEPKENSLSIGQTLCRDYSLEESKRLLLEMNDDLCFRLRMAKKKTSVVSLYVGYSAKVGGGFSRQLTLPIASDDNETIYQNILTLLMRFGENLPIRNLGISFGQVRDYDFSQLNLFDSPEKEEANRRFHLAMDAISIQYGANACLRASSQTESSTIRERHQQIGGHKA